MKELLPGQAEAIAEVESIRNNVSRANSDSMDLIFTKAHTHNAWSEKSVSRELIQEAYDLAKMGPTAMNMQPMRMVFLESESKKERLIPLMLDSNQQKTHAAPMTVILANDHAFYKKLHHTFPIMPNADMMFANDAVSTKENAERNGTLQAAYFMLALRSVGLDVAPMSGFDPIGVNNEFFNGTDTKVNFILNIGYGDTTGVYPRLPRLPLNEVADFFD